ncbi:hypothetical protein ACFQ3Z_33075 [Streptomyces nogalater]
MVSAATRSANSAISRFRATAENRMVAPLSRSPLSVSGPTAAEAAGASCPAADCCVC